VQQDARRAVAVREGSAEFALRRQLSAVGVLRKTWPPRHNVSLMWICGIDFSSSNAWCRATGNGCIRFNRTLLKHDHANTP
jgi:hypothetical protein